MLIAGGGHAGLLLALALDRLGLAAGVIDAQAVDLTLAAPFGGRALALMYGSKRVFETLGLWPRLADLAEPVWGVRVEDQSTGAGIAYEAAEVADHPFGFGIETRALRRRCWSSPWSAPGSRSSPRRGSWISSGPATDRGHARRRPAPRCRSVRRRRRARLHGAGPRRPRRLLVALSADRAHLRDPPRPAPRPAGPRVSPTRPARSRCCRSATNLSSVTWTEPAALAQHLLAGPSGALESLLQERIGDVLGAFEVVGEPAADPLGGHRARRYVAPRVALVGDAAHGIHPIHAQGFNLAVRDVATLAEILVEAERAGRDLGQPTS